MASSMKIICVIQARINSKRLKGKVLLKIKNKPVLNHIIDRITYCKFIEKTIVATTYKKEDLKIVNLCKKLSIPYYRGRVNDVLSRYYYLGKKYKADGVLRITADCPLIDPEIIDKIIIQFKKNKYDSFGLIGNFPDGLDCTVYSQKALEYAYKFATKKSDREHVGTYIDRNNKKFKLGGSRLYNFKEYYRWTLDEKKDFNFIKKIYQYLYDKNKIFLTKDIINLLKRKPHLKKINSGIKRNEGYVVY